MALSPPAKRKARVSPSPERTVKFGIIGTGRIAADFANDLKHLKHAALHAVLSREMNSAEAFQTAHGAARAYASMDTFMADPEIDIVYVASPNSAHLAQALAALSARKAVLVEKPLAASSSEAESIRAEAGRSGTFAMEAMWIRFLPGIQRAKALIQSGAIGQVKSARGELSYFNAFDPDSRLFSKALGGGSSRDLGVYLLSLTQYLFGAPKTVSGQWKASASGVDSAANYQLSYPDFSANLSTSFDRDGHNVFEIEGTGGILRIEDPFIQARRLRVLTGTAAKPGFLRPVAGAKPARLQKLLARLPLPGQKVIAFNYPGNGLQFEAEAVAEAVRTSESGSSLAPLGDSIAVLKMIENVLSQPASLD
jgi:predicted dehydrogenase